MALLTHRLLIIVVLINIMIGIGMEAYYSPSTFVSANINTEIDIMEENEQDFESDDSIWGSVKTTGNRLYENTIGSPIKWGWNILKVFTRAINPFSFTPGDFTDPVEKVMAWVIMLFRSLMTTIIIIEAYMFFKSGKTS